MVVEPAGWTVSVLQTGTRSDEQFGVRPELCAKINILAIRNALEILVKQFAADSVGAKAHETTTEPVNRDRARVSKLIGVPVYRLAFVMKRAPNKERTPNTMN
jgi:hypothetical protein